MNKDVRETNKAGEAEIRRVDAQMSEETPNRL